MSAELLLGIAIALIVSAALAYRWKYSVIGWNRDTRRNLQYLLVATLLTAGLIVGMLGATRL